MAKSKHRKNFKVKQQNRRERLAAEKRAENRKMADALEKAQKYFDDQQRNEAIENVSIANKMQQPSNPFDNDLVKHSIEVKKEDDEFSLSKIVETK